MKRALILWVVLRVAILPITTDAVAEDLPLGEAETYFKSMGWASRVLAYSEYKYMMDIPKNHDIVVAVIDDYMSSDHESLAGQYWVNEAELNGTTGVDDDNNGYVDDIHGWDFDGDQPYPADVKTSVHGNHVVGLIVGKPLVQEYSDWTPYRLRLRGINPDAKVMRIYQGESILYAVDEARAIRYAVDNGARVINLSHHIFDNQYGDLLNAVTYAKEKGVFVVVGGPNFSLTTEIFIDHWDDVFAVARNTYSPGWGQHTDIYAVSGVWHDKIDYCLPQRMKAMLNSNANIGTSYSTPILSGIIARLLMYDNEISHEEMREILDENSVESSGTLSVSGPYTCKRPSAELLFKNYYEGEILRRSVAVENDAGKSAIFNIETVVDNMGQVIRREVRHINSDKNRYWVLQEIDQ